MYIYEFFYKLHNFKAMETCFVKIGTYTRKNHILVTKVNCSLRTVMLHKYIIMWLKYENKEER
jgi:hypothetical protein